MRSLLALVSMCLLSGLATAQLGQTPSSHLDDSNEPLPENIMQLLDASAAKARSKLNDNQIKDLVKKLSKNIDSKPFDEDKIKSLLDAYPAFKDPENIKRIRDMLQKEMKDTPDSRIGKLDLRSLDNALKNLNKLGSKIEPNDPKDPRETDPSAQPNRKPNAQQPPQPGKNDKALEEFSRWAMKNFGDTPATRGVVNDIAELMIQNDKGGLQDILRDFEKEWNSLAVSKDNQSTLAQLGDLLAGAKLPDLNPPQLGSASGHTSNMGGSNAEASPSASSSPSSEWGEFSRVSLILALLGIGGLLYWYVRIHAKAAKEADARAVKLAWPVEPMAVATREDIVKAFAFLSIAKCGEEAVTWHHRQIAADLTGKEPQKREAVQHLAGLYEKARYAPVNDLFTEREIVEARTRLCQVAGVASE